MGQLAPILLFALALAACGGGGGKGGGDKGGGEEPITAAVGGAVQKGPFLIGSSVTVQELGSNLEPTGTQFNTATINDLGHFATSVQIASPFVEVITSGFFFDEVCNQLSPSSLVLRTISEYVEGQVININLLTQLARDRVKTLVLAGQSFTAAQAQAQTEILAVFNITGITGIGDFDSLDISGSGTGNAVLLAISSVLMQAAVDSGTCSAPVGPLSELMANLGADISPDGILDSATLKERLRQAGINLNLAGVRANLERRYANLGSAISAAPFENYLDSDGDGIIQLNDDNLPDAFAFSPVANVDPSAVQITPEVTISGVTGVAPVTLTGGSLLKNCNFADPSLCTAETATTSGGTTVTKTDVKNGDRLRVRLTADSTYGKTVTASLKVGDLTRTFDVSTFALTTMPFTLTAATDVLPSMDNSSNIITVAGVVYTHLPVTLSSGTLLKDTGSGLGALIPNATTGVTTTTVKNGDKLQVRLKASSSFFTKLSATLTIGLTTGAFDVTTCTQAVCLKDGIFVATTGSDSALGNQAAPLKTIQAAIDLAASLSPKPTVNVSAGTYTVGHITLKEGVSVLGGWATNWSARNPTANATVLTDSTALGGTDTVPNRAVDAGTGLTSATKLDGFTINGGGGTHSTGILITDSSPTISNNVINGGTATNAYGIRVRSTGALTVSPAITSNTINGATAGTTTTTGNAFGVYITGGAAPAISSNTIRAVVAGSLNSNGIRALNSPAFSISGNTIDNVQGSSNAAGIEVQAAAGTVSILNNKISGISTDVQFMDGIHLDSSSATLTGNTIDLGASFGTKTAPASGIRVTGTATVTVTIGGATTSLSNTINGGTAVHTHGIFLNSASGTTVTVQNNQSIKGGTGTSSSHGIEIVSTPNATVTGNNIDGGKVTQNGNTFGILSDNSSNPSYTTTITKNTIFGGKGGGAGGTNHGIKTIRGTGVKISGNTVSGGLQPGTGAGTPTSIGILTDRTGVLINNNTVHGGSGGDNSVGIRVDFDFSVTANALNNTVNGGAGTIRKGISLQAFSVPGTANVKNNIVFNDGGTGYCFYEENTSSDPATLQNNDAFNCSTAFYRDEGTTNFNQANVGSCIGNFGLQTTLPCDTPLTTPTGTGNLSTNPSLVDSTRFNKGTLNFTGQTANFTNGQTLTGGSSGATAVISTHTDAGTTGTLTLVDIKGLFQDGETITSSGGVASTKPSWFRFFLGEAFATAAAPSGSATASGTVSFTNIWQLPDSCSSVLTGGQDLSGSGFTDDKAGATRNPPWSMGAYENNFQEC